MANGRMKERRFGERRGEEDNGAWRIFDDVWCKVAHRRHEDSRRSGGSLPAGYSGSGS